MSRWTIEKDGTGIEKSGTGVERSGTGIEKSGTGIERSGTGIEKSGTGIQRFVFACALAFISFASNLQAGALSPSGSLQLVVDQDTVAVSWIIDGSVFSGISPLSGSFASLQLTEIALASQPAAVDVTGGGTDSSTLVTGGGTGSSPLVTGGGTGGSLQITGGGTGGKTEVTGGGTGFSVQVTGGGTGSSTLVTGGGTGSSTLVTGGGTGSSALVTGGGTGSSVLVTGGGTGAEAIAITLPDGTGLAMNISLGCGSATVTVLDSNFAPVAMFNNVNVVGDTGLCGGPTGGSFTEPGFDYILN
jgi:hypothetical protein